MENASKALLIAAGVLVAILILSIATTFYLMFSRQAKSYTQIVSKTEIDKFNTKFSVYLGQENIKAQEVISIVNSAKEYNNQVQISVYKKNGVTLINTANSELFLKEWIDISFKCDASSATYDADGKIKTMKFIANS